MPFPFVEQDEERVRPALVVSARRLGVDGDLFWALMITSSKGREMWPGDILLGDDHASYGLPVPCFIRTAKLSTLSIAKVERQLGQLSDALFDEVKRTMADRLQLDRV